MDRGGADTAARPDTWAPAPTKLRPDWVVSAGEIGSYCGPDLAVDRWGNSLITGSLRERTAFGSTTLTPRTPLGDIYVAKLDATGKFVWVVQVTAGDHEYFNSWGMGSQAIAVDSAGSAYIAGWFSGVVAFGSSTISSGTKRGDLFMAKLNGDGKFVWAHVWKRWGNKSANAIAVDPSGNICVSGFLENVCIIAKLDSDGRFLWTRSVSGLEPAGCGSAEADSSGGCYVTGYFTDTAECQDSKLTLQGSSSDIFVTRLDRDGRFVWAISAGGKYKDSGISIALDKRGSIYLTGSYYDTATIGNKVLKSTGKDKEGTFIAKLDSAGKFLWVVPDSDVGDVGFYSVAVDGSGNSAVTGEFFGTATFGNTVLTSRGGSDVFVARLDPGGRFLPGVPAISAGGTGEDVAYSIALPGANRVYISGRFSGTATFGRTTLTSRWPYEIFVARYTISGM
jgi:hypothetical protein